MTFLLLIFSAIMPILTVARQDYLHKSFGSTEDYDMIIIAPSTYESAIEPLIEHKNSRGIISFFVSTDKIYDGTYFEVHGRDNQEKIKYFIKEAIENWGISYVLFIGNFRQIPVRYCFNNDEYKSYETNFISELYYADIYDSLGNFSSWDIDEDKIFGEWDGNEAEDKPIDLKPDVCLGRLACRNSKEVEILVKKIINYEKQPADPSWFKRFVVCGGDTFSGYPGSEGEIYNQMAIDIMSDFSEVKLWASNGNLTEKGWAIVNLINQGCGFLYLSGHGSPKTWATRSSDGKEVGNFNQFMMMFLFNCNRLPVCLVGGCHNSQFDTNLLNLLINPRESWIRSTWFPKCWSWKLTSKINGGAIATIGTTGLCWYSCEFDGGGTDWLNIQFFREYQKNERIIGKIWKNALIEYLDTYPIDWETPSGGNFSLRAKTIQQWTLLGDPSLQIGGGNPTL